MLKEEKILRNLGDKPMVGFQPSGTCQLKSITLLVANQFSCFPFCPLRPNIRETEAFFWDESRRCSLLYCWAASRNRSLKATCVSWICSTRCSAPVLRIVAISTAYIALSREIENCRESRRPTASARALSPHLSCCFCISIVFARPSQSRQCGSWLAICSCSWYSAMSITLHYKQRGAMNESLSCVFLPGKQKLGNPKVENVCMLGTQASSTGCLYILYCINYGYWVGVFYGLGFDLRLNENGREYHRIILCPYCVVLFKMAYDSEGVHTAKPRLSWNSKHSAVPSMHCFNLDERVLYIVSL